MTEFLILFKYIRRGGYALVLGVAVLLSGLQCSSDSPTGSASPVSIISAHRSDGKRVVWDPNDEPVLSLAATTDDPNLGLDDLQWRQEGWQVDDSQWIGRSLRVSVETPGCGYGGHEFRVTALWPDGRVAAAATIWMEKYICEGSPWAGEQGP